MKKQCLYLLIAALIPSVSFADWVVGQGNGMSTQSARVKSVSSDWGNTGSFGVEVEGGSGICTNRWVVFDKTAMSAETYRNSFELAKLAFIHGFKVNIYNYAENGDCNTVDFIEVVRN